MSRHSPPWSGAISESAHLSPGHVAPRHDILSIQAFEYQKLYFGEGITFKSAPFG